MSKSLYSWRGRVGVIVPPTNTVNEIEWNKMSPTGVSIHATRMPLHSNPTSSQEEKLLYRDIEKAIKLLSPANLNVIAYGCTAGSMMLPIEKLSDFMKKTSSCACVTTAASIVAAIEVLGVNKIALATPYDDILNNHEKLFLEKCGISVQNIRGLGIGSGGAHEYTQIAKVPPKQIYEHIISADSRDADALVISCTDFPVLGIIDQLEAELDKPVITSNQATFWAALRAANIDYSFDSYGVLLREY